MPQFDLEADEVELLESYRRRRRAAQEASIAAALVAREGDGGSAARGQPPTGGAIEPGRSVPALTPALTRGVQREATRRDLLPVQVGIRIAGAAVVLGVLGDILVRNQRLGLNAGLLAAALVAATVAILGAQSVPARWPTRLLLLTGLAFSAALSWRASPTLAALNLSAAAVAFILTLPRPWRLASGLPRDYLALLAHWLGLAASGWFGLLSGERFPGEAAAAARNRISRVGGLSSVLRASLVALPLLVVFGALMSSADAAFASALGRVFAFPVDATEAVRRVMLSLVYSYLFAGHLHGLARVAPATAAARAGWAGRTEVIVILGSVAALFLAFVLVQVGYLFGGAGGARVAGLTYAEYARRGFFELVLVTALVLPLLTVGHGQVRREEPGAERAFRLLATTLLVLLIVIVASAFRRLGAYTEAFGLTELRLYTAAFMAWLVLVLAWFGLTVLRGQDRRLAAGALAAGFLCLGALNLANPDGLIVRVNTARAVGGSQLDATYLATLSADAVPALRAALPTLPAEDKRVINAALARFRTEAHGDWRSWNLAHANAADD